MDRPRPKWYHLRWHVVLPLLALGWFAHYRLIGRFHFPLGTGPAGPDVPAEAFAAPWREGPVLFLGIGDSVTEGYGALPGHGYFDLLEHNDDALHPGMKGRDLSAVFPKMTSMNRAISYTVSMEHLKDQLVLVPVQPPEVFGVVVVTTGGNDLIHDYGQTPPRDGALYGATWEQSGPWLKALRERIEKIVDGIAAKFPGGCEIFLANIFDPTDGVGDIENATLALPAWKDGLRILTQVNLDLRSIAAARPHVHLVDIRGVLLGHGIHCADRRNPHHDEADPYYWYFENLEDPNDRGYDAVRRQFLLEMIRVFKPRKGG